MGPNGFPRVCTHPYDSTVGHSTVRNVPARLFNTIGRTYRDHSGQAGLGELVLGGLIGLEYLRTPKPVR